MLQFRIDSGDNVLKKHFETAPKNAVYNSKTIQNELIAVSGEWILQKIINRVKKANFFAVMADEIADTSNTEQMSIVLRYVNEDCEIKEDSILFCACRNGTTGEALANNILTTLQHHGLDLRFLRGQGYDGAGAMAGSVNGTAKRIQTTYPLALYTHCYSHKLNLVIVQACSIQQIWNAMGVVSKVAFFFENSPKRQAALEDKISQTEQPNKKKHLIDLCRTRWIHRHEAFENFAQLFEVFVDLFEDISSSRDWNRDTSADASTLLIAITKFDFMMAFVIAWKALSLVKPLSIGLQSSSMDICKAYEEVASTTRSIQHIRNNVDQFHLEWFRIAESKAASIGADSPSLPRRCGRQLGRSNVSAENPCEYFKRAITIPFLDHLLCELHHRFDAEQLKVLRGLSLVPAIMKKDQQWRQNAMDLVSFYEDDVPSFHNFDMELVSLEMKWADQNSEELPNSPDLTLRQCSVKYFPNIHTLLRIICTLPVTSCSCERSISGLRRLKTYLRSTMGQDRLNGLALMHFHYSINVDVGEILDMFARKHPRRMTLIDVFNSDS